MFSKKITERKSEAVHNKKEQTWKQCLLRKDYTGQKLISSLVYPLCYCWCVLKTNQGDLCSCTDVLPGATGCTLGVCIVFWPMGLVDNLHLVAIECDGAEVSTGPWIRSVGCWFITWHANRARWCISKKFTKIIIEIHMRCRNSDSAQGCLALQPPAPSHLSSDLIDLYFDRY